MSFSSVEAMRTAELDLKMDDNNATHTRSLTSPAKHDTTNSSPTIAAARSEQGSSAMPDMKLSYIQARISRSQPQKDGTPIWLTEAKRAIEESEKKLKSLHEVQNIEKEALGDAYKRMEGLGAVENHAKRRREGAVIKVLQASIHSRHDQISATQKSLKSSKSDLPQLEVALKKQYTQLKVRATRQAEILDLLPWEFATLAEFGNTNREFRNKVEKAMGGNATQVMIRDIKSALFDKLTGISQEEFQELMKKIWNVEEPDETGDSNDELMNGSDESEDESVDEWVPQGW